MVFLFDRFRFSRPALISFDYSSIFDLIVEEPLHWKVGAIVVLLEMDLSVVNPPVHGLMHEAGLTNGADSNQEVHGNNERHVRKEVKQ